MQATERRIPPLSGGMKRRQRVHPPRMERQHGDFTFTYPGWQDHAKKVEQTTNTSFMKEGMPLSSKPMAQKMILGMQRFQQIHDGKLKHETIRKLRIAQFTYPRWKHDVNEAMECYLRMEDALASTIVKDIVRKQKEGTKQRQRVHQPRMERNQGDFTFTYPGWQDHAKKVEQTLTNTSFMNAGMSLSSKPMAQKMILGMQRFQQIHDGKLKHETIRKLRIAQFTYPRWQHDVNEVMECYLRMEDALASTIVKDIVRKQKLQSSGRSDGILAMIDKAAPSTFTYPGWERHSKLIEQTLANTYNQLEFSCGKDRNEVAVDMLKGMKRFQNIYKERIRNNNILQLFKSEGIFSYPNWKKHKEEALIHYLKLEDKEGEDVFNAMNLKQDIYEGDRSNSILVELDSASYTYPGHQDHAKTLEMALTNTFTSNCGESREESARKILVGMRRLQQVFVGKSRHQGISHLQNGIYSYPRWERDKAEALDHYLRFQDNNAREVHQMMANKQRMHDGDRSDEVLVLLDHLTAEKGPTSVSDESPRDVMRRIEFEVRGMPLLKGQPDGLANAKKRDMNKSNNRRGPRETMRLLERKFGSNIKNREPAKRYQREF